MSCLQIKKICNAEKGDIEKAMRDIKDKYGINKKGGIIMIEASGKYQLATHPDNAFVVKEFLKSQVNGELTDPSLETLTIISYRGPISKPELERIRGVNCSLILRNLLIRGLIEKKDDKKGGLSSYCVTNEFVKFLGVSSVSELPSYEVLSKNETLAMALRAEEDVPDIQNSVEMQILDEQR